MLCYPNLFTRLHSTISDHICFLHFNDEILPMLRVKHIALYCHTHKVSRIKMFENGVVPFCDFF